MLAENISSSIAKELKINPHQSDAVIKLLDEGNTIPFISRYRKEATGELDEEKIRLISERLTYLRNFVKRQEEILGRIEEQGKLTDELRAAIEATAKLQELEDIYLPYKQKKRTRASIAKEKGLEPLSAAMLLQSESKGDAKDYASRFINEEKGVASADDALAGAMDIIAEAISEDAALRQQLRRFLWNNAFLITSLDSEKEETELGQTYLMYKEYRELVRTLPSHRVLAINRGEKQECLKVKLEADTDSIINKIESSWLKDESIFTAYIKDAITDSWKRLIAPSLEREIRSQLTEDAEKQAIHIFGTNLKQLLLQAVYGVLLALDLVDVALAEELTPRRNVLYQQKRIDVGDIVRDLCRNKLHHAVLAFLPVLTVNVHNNVAIIVCDVKLLPHFLEIVNAVRPGCAAAPGAGVLVDGNVGHGHRIFTHEGGSVLAHGPCPAAGICAVQRGRCHGGCRLAAHNKLLGTAAFCAFFVSPALVVLKVFQLRVVAVNIFADPAVIVAEVSQTHRYHIVGALDIAGASEVRRFFTFL